MNYPEELRDKYNEVMFNARDLIDDNSYNLDLPEAENLLQIITFGEAIYG